ncbi:MAG: hypothetical protein M3020_02490 [Myxococcota bacterium]|nr:hypothetical protein [Myxococcota bacterium]
MTSPSTETVQGLLEARKSAVRLQFSPAPRNRLTLARQAELALLLDLAIRDDGGVVSSGELLRRFAEQHDIRDATVQSLVHALGTTLPPAFRAVEWRSPE